MGIITKIHRRFGRVEYRNGAIEKVRGEDRGRKRRVLEVFCRSDKKIKERKGLRRRWRRRRKMRRWKRKALSSMLSLYIKSTFRLASVVHSLLPYTSCNS